MSQLKIKLLKNLYPYKKGEVIEMSEEKYATKKFLQRNSEIIEDIEEEETKEEEEVKVEVDLNITNEELEVKDNLIQDMIEETKEEVIEDEKQIEVVTKPKKASNKAILKPKTNK